MSNARGMPGGGEGGMLKLRFDRYISEHQQRLSWAQLFEGRLALNPGFKFNPGFFFLCSKAFFRIIFSVILRASNHQLVHVGKKNEN